MKKTVKNKSMLKSASFSREPSVRRLPARRKTSAGSSSVEIRQLREDVLKVSTFERERLGHELHDDFAQNLAGIACLSKQLQSRMLASHPHLAELAGEITMELGQVLERIRTVAHELVPYQLHETDLVPHLEKLIKQTGRRTGVACRGELDRSIQIDDVTVRLHVYRISQEAVRNAIHHGKATEITVRLSRDGSSHVRLTIRDNGRGFYRDLPASDGLGVRLMQYRCCQVGGTLSLDNGNDGGAIVECVFPLQQDLFQEPQPKELL